MVFRYVTKRVKVTILSGSIKSNLTYFFYKFNNFLLVCPLYTVILSFLRREPERFPLFVPRHYCVPTRTFLGVPDRSALQRSWAFSNVRDFFKTRKARKRSSVRLFAVSSCSRFKNERITVIGGCKINFEIL